MHFEWNGVFPALTTKFTADDQLDLPLFEKNLQAQLNAGVHGIVLGGTLGEASVLTTAEKEQLVKFAVEKCAVKVPVILNIAEGSTREALQQAVNAKTWGAQGLMMLPPMRYKSDHRETVTYFKTVADSTDLPIMIYNNPVDYKIEVTLDMFAELAACKNINAVKESTRDVTNVTRMRNRFGDRFKLLCGVDTLAMEELCLGADGWVAGLVCAFPKETVAIYNLVKAGRIAEATGIYRWFMPLLELDIHPKLVQYIKLAEAQVGLGSEYVRAPRLALTGKEREDILKIITDGIAARPNLG
ncbi:MAG TPA: dihydrodipicolinate synthase family protein [Ferruginibacter sp.]|nr:dihydrodipicolinate synthase family protein [Ferruginibacter sp.]HNF03640.1 dihydrodipicolinate synthase family protein [Ferruginibacter sp.]HNG62856.1 dihydrodipicolinate synthase family protein [Ferruginibacter sp.]HNK29238.1 dihydrodipicolinate synthase family protein [Ferruginibacter sp.]HNP00533.1 dihydrodipicolinate synthase family protein [Ferruginibacter sp.]